MVTLVTKRLLLEDLDQFCALDVEAQKQARSLKFWIKVEEELYYPSSENKGDDQLRGYREADLRLCFRLCRLLVFPRGGSNVSS